MAFVSTATDIKLQVLGMVFSPLFMMLGAMGAAWLRKAYRK